MSTPRTIPSRRSERGLSLLELTLMLAALTIIAAAVTPAALRVLHEQRQNAARAEMRALHEAIYGADDSDVYGYIGDMGRLPYSLDELVVLGSQPVMTRSELTGVGAGWNGPYLTGGRDADDYRVDPWGNAYDFGVVGIGQVRSAGPSGQFGDGDDLVFPAIASSPYGVLIVNVIGHSEDIVVTTPDGCVVTLDYSNSGAPATVLDDAAPFSFEDVHRGLHAVAVSCPRYDGGTATAQTVIQLRGGSAQQVAELHVELGGTPSEAAEEESSSPQESFETTGAGLAPFAGQR